MRIYVCRLTLHESLFYATREAGRLYETGRFLHNYALTYALGLVVSPYAAPVQVPRYREELTPLNERGIYVTPARGVEVAFQLATFKYANNAYHVEMEKGSRNTPSFGRAKELATGSVFEFAVLSVQEALKLPRWVRLGLWMSKAHLTWQEFQAERKRTREAIASFPLNPLDVEGQLRAFDLISMPPSSVVDNAALESEWWEWSAGEHWERLPANLAYQFPEPD